MLEIKGVNKYFNRHKKNEIHVINNTNIEIKENGLVALLGNSGSGKTTLLNVIGGLDKVKSGKIYVNGKLINSRLSSKIDKVRNLNIGYIFQDYKLIDNLSVYDNVSIVLKMIGVKDKQEIKKRVEYVLECVGMLRYKKRPASMLSGGERQRVGIARAIVKNPSIILADEPTGNLDSKNSLEVMKIIKSISKDRLVILVTHEANLAKFYADRIIEIEDGKVINDYKNEHDLELDYKMDNRFYLKDFNTKTEINKNKSKIKIYKNEETPINLDIVVEGNNIYIKSNDDNKIEVVNNNSSIEFVDEHYKNILKSDVDKYNFNFKEIINPNIKLKYSSILNIFNLITNGFKKVFNYSFLKKILLIGFFIAGIFIMYSTSSIAASLKIEDKNFVKTNKNYLILNINKIKVDDYLKYEQMENINYILPGNSSISFNMIYDDYYQTNTATSSLNGSLSSLEMIKNNKLLYGKYPKDKYEIIVDKLSIEKMFDEGYAKMAGICKIKDMLNRKITINNMPEFKIVGIIDNKSPSIYVDPSLFIDIIFNSNTNINNNEIMNYELFKDQIEIKQGSYPKNDYETLVNIDNKDQMPLNKEIDIKVNNKKLKVVGYYNSKYNYNYYFVNTNTIKYESINTSNNITIYSNDKNKTIEEFTNLKLNIYDSYTKDRREYIKERQEYIRNTILVSGIMLIISLVEIFLMIRSSFLSRIKEIGIYRAIGVKKSDIYKMFMGEIIAITTSASIPGLIIMAYILKVLSNIKYLSSYFIINISIVILAILFIYLFNLIIGLIPIFNTMRKTPSEILSRYDVD